MLLAIIIILLLSGNWLISEILIFIPVNFLTRLTAWGWWGMGMLVVLFIAWCLAEDK